MSANDPADADMSDDLAATLFTVTSRRFALSRVLVTHERFPGAYDELRSEGDAVCWHAAINDPVHGLGDSARAVNALDSWISPRHVLTPCGAYRGVFDPHHRPRVLFGGASEVYTLNSEHDAEPWWGFDGPGALNTARLVLSHACAAPAEEVKTLAVAFVAEVLSRLPRRGEWVLPRHAVRQWASKRSGVRVA